MKKVTFLSFFMNLIIVLNLAAADPVVSNIQVTSVGRVELNQYFSKWTITATFTVADSDNQLLRIWAGLRSSEGWYFKSSELSGDTSVTPGSGYSLSFTVTDTGNWNNAQVKVIAWDRDGWPPWPAQPFFQRHHHWALDVSNGAVDPNSSGYLNYQTSQGISGMFPIYPDHPTFLVRGDHAKKNALSITYSSESDNVPIPWPHINLGDPSSAYSEFGTDGHVNIIDVDNYSLYETFIANKQSSGDQDWTVSQISLFDLGAEKYMGTIPDPNDPYAWYRGSKGWTSADAAGMAIVPGLILLHEVEEGTINHALRYTTTGTGGYIYPGLHKQGSSSVQYATPMGLRIRLKASFNIDARIPEDGTEGRKTAKIIIRAMQKYGLFCTDGGNNIAIMAERDQHTELKWATFGSSGGAQSDIVGFAFAAAGITRETLLSEFEVIDKKWQWQQYVNYEALRP